MTLYMRYLMQTKWVQTIVISLIPSMISMSIILFTRSYINANPNAYLPDPTIMITPVVFIIMLSILMPMIRLSALKNSKDVDLYYALPITQTKLYLSHLLFGLFQLLVAWTAVFLLSSLVFIGVYPGYYNTLWFIPLYVIGLLYISLVYSLNSFIFMKANSIIDGVAFIFMFQLALILIPGFGVILGYSFLGDSLPFIVNPYSGIITWASTFISLSNPLPNSFVLLTKFYEDPERTITLIVHSILYLSLAVGALVYTLKSMDQYKVENIGTVSHSLFGYKLMIPLILFLSISSILEVSLGSHIAVIFILILVSIAVIGYFIYRRSVKLTKMDILSIAASLVASIIIRLF